MTATLRLALPSIAAGQAQKHVTHNEALEKLDAVVQIAVRSRTMAAPPTTPAEGERWLIAGGATGTWTGQGGRIAEWRDAAWRYHDPVQGWICWIEDERLLLVLGAQGWRGILDEGKPDNLRALGIGTAADSVNLLAVKANASLFTARSVTEGGNGDLRISINKDLPTGVASLLFQSAYSGRAEIGLVGDNHLRLRVSDTGTIWRDALSIDAATGALRVLPGTNAAPSVTAPSDQSTGLVFPAAGAVALAAGGQESMRVTASQILAGTTASLAPSQAPTARMQIGGTAASSSSMALGRFSANAGTSSINFLKSRAASVGGTGAVLANDVIGQINFDGDTGAGFELGARISVQADGAAASGSMPSRLTFSTSANGSSTPTERMRISATGAVNFPSIGTTASAGNAFLDSASGNTLLRSTSSRRYKREIEPLTDEVADRILALRPVRYRSTVAHDRADWSWYGLIAEEVAEIDPRLVHWSAPDSGGEADDRPISDRLAPDAVQYDRMAVLLIDVVRRQHLLLGELTQRINSLEAVATR